MPIDPSIISNVLIPDAPRLPNVNAMMQTQQRGMENMIQMERQRAADAASAQEQEMEAAARALAPAIASAFSDPSDEGLNIALSMAPPVYRAAAKAQIDQLRAVPDLNRRKDMIRAALMQEDYGRAIIAQVEETANMRLQADTAAQAQALRMRELQLQERQAARGPEPSYKEVVLEDGTLALVDQKSGRVILPSMESPIDTALPPQEGVPTPLKVRQKDGAATESERLGGYNAGRALAAAKRIAAALKNDPEATAPGIIETGVGLIVDPNIIRSEGRQRVSAAQRELIDALLTLATGAAYNKEQLAGQMESYIPKWSDEPGTREDKRMALLDLIQSAKVKAGRAWTPEMDTAFNQLLTPPSASNAAAPAVAPAADAADAAGFEILGTEPE